MIYIVTHNKGTEIPDMDGYKLLEVGGIYKGNNPINRYNPYLNETTAMWDIYNSGDEIVGLVHYRRLFKDLTYDKAVHLLQTYDVITIPLYGVIPYRHLTDNLDKKLVDKYVNQLPQEIQKWFHEYNPLNLCNLFVAKREFLAGYIKLLDLVIPMADQFINEDVSDDVKSNRTLGYICECLFGYYCKDFNRYFCDIQLL